MIYMIRSARSLAQNPYHVLFNAYKMDGAGHISQEKIDVLLKEEVRVINTRIADVSSLGHAHVANIIFKKFVKDQINIISDSDVVICQKKWDYDIIKLLDQYDVVGTRYEDIGGPCVEKHYPNKGTLHQTYKEKPNLIWCAFSSKNDVSDLNISAPNSLSTIVKISSEEQSDIWRLPIGYFLWKDMGWEFPRYCHEKGLSWYSFYKCNPYVRVSPQGTSAVVLDSRFLNGLSYQDAIYCEEYHKHDGIPFIVHQRGSRKKKFREDKLSKCFYDSYERFVRANNG